MNTQLFLPLLLLPYLAMATASTDVVFTATTAEAQVRAAQEGKLYFVHFTATWCVPCAWMEANTFTNDTLATYVNEHYLAVKMDFDDPNAANFKKSYQVTSLPSLLVFNAKGELVDRYKTSLSKDELLQILGKQTSTILHPRKPENGGATRVKLAYNDGGKIYRPALVPDDSKTAAKPAIIAETPVTAAPKKSMLQPAEEKSVVAKFTIQVGVYSDIANAERTRTRMAQSFRQPVEIMPMQQNGKQLYKIMLGKFAEKAAAEKFLQQLENQGEKGFVRSMNN